MQAPSSSRAFASTLVMSSRGLLAALLRHAREVAEELHARASFAVSRPPSPSPWYSGSPEPTVRLVQRNSISQSLRGTPSRSQSTASGSGPEMRSTKSISPSGPSA